MLITVVLADGTGILAFTAIEPTVGILCGCFPVIFPSLGKRVLRERFTSKDGTNPFVHRLLGSGSNRSQPPQLEMWPKSQSSQSSGQWSGRRASFLAIRNVASDREGHAHLRQGPNDPQVMNRAFRGPSTPMREGSDEGPVVRMEEISVQTDLEWGIYDHHDVESGVVTDE